MGDVRSMLRNERASRRIDHSQASYSATGTLECIVCHISLKSDPETWDKHLKSTQHAMRAERLRLSSNVGPAGRESSSITKKRKADGEAGTSGAPKGVPATREMSGENKKRKASDGEDDFRKRTRPIIKPIEGSLNDFLESSDPDKPRKTIPIPHQPLRSPEQAEIDESEWAAFERDVATPPPNPSTYRSAPLALRAAATISAAPLTAAELAAQSRARESMQSNERREAQAEGEKEDAARAREEEFEEMEDLEERVRRLRGKREELRVRIAAEGGIDAEDDREGIGMDGIFRSEGDERGGGVEKEKDDYEDDNDDVEDEGDEWDGWGRRGIAFVREL